MISEKDKTIYFGGSNIYSVNIEYKDAILLEKK